jgi:hypothetical protein
VDRAIEAIKADNDLCPPVHIAKASIVDSVHATAVAVSGSVVEMDAMVGCVDRALTMAHDSGMRLWYNSNPVLLQYVFHDPRIVTELLRVLMEPIHLSREHDTTHLESQLSWTVVRDLMNGRMNVSAIDVLWKDFGDRHEWKGDALRQTVINMLEQLNLLTRDRDTVDVYMSMHLMRRFDFASHQRQSFVRSERMTTVVLPSQSLWYALDIVFEAGSQIAGPGGVMMTAGILPEDLAEKFLLRLYDQQSVWWRSVAVGAEMTRLQLFRNCLTDGKLCEVTSTRTGRGDKVFRALLCDPTHSCAPGMAKQIMDIFEDLVRAQYPSVFYKTRVVLGPCVMYTHDGDGPAAQSALTTPVLHNEPDSWHFWLSGIRLTENGYADPNQTSRHDDPQPAGQASERDGMICPVSHAGSTRVIHVSRVWPITATRPPTSDQVRDHMEAAEAYALRAVVSDSPQSVLSIMFSHQGVKLDPDNVEAAATTIAAYLQSIGVMPLQQ